jgi:hypothetical protein
MAKVECKVSLFFAPLLREPHKRQQQRLERDLQASQSTLQTAARTAEQQEYCCRADAEAAAA